MDAGEPKPDGSCDYHYEYDLLHFHEGERLLVARSYSDHPSEVHFLRVEHGPEARRLIRSDMTGGLATEAIAHLRTLGKTEINWLSGAGNGYEPVPAHGP